MMNNEVKEMKKLMMGIVCAFLLVLSACSNSGAQTKQESAAQKKDAEAELKIEDLPGSVEGGKKYTAVITVKDYGPITLTLDEGVAPETVKNFVKLANEGFYNGLTFHRIMDGFMIQGGDPNGNGTGGSSQNVKGEFLSNGFNNTLSHKKGVISMARAMDPNSGSSQFFIMDEDNASLDGNYAAFGYVTEGMDIVQKIADDAKPTDNNGTIEKDQQPVIESITITDQPAN